MNKLLFGLEHFDSELRGTKSLERLYLTNVVGTGLYRETSHNERSKPLRSLMTHPIDISQTGIVIL